MHMHFRVHISRQLPVGTGCPEFAGCNINSLNLRSVANHKNEQVSVLLVHLEYSIGIPSLVVNAALIMTK